MNGYTKRFDQISENRINKLAVLYLIENVVTLLSAVAIILGSRYLGAGVWSWIGLFVLMNLNNVKFRQ